MTRVDLGFSLLLSILGAAVVWESWKMPRLADQGVEAYSVPGLVPGLIGCILCLLGLVLLVRSLSRLCHGGGGPSIESPPIALRRFVMTTALTLSYAAVLVGRVPFWLATFLFVCAFICLFEYKSGGNWRRLIITASLQAALVAAAVTFLFRYLFLVRLP